MTAVTIVQRILPHYRIPFFRHLHRQLLQSGIALRLIYGQERPGTVPRTVRIDEDWARFVANRYLPVAGHDLVWQPASRESQTSNLVIVEHSSRLLANYQLLFQSRRRKTRFACWGHGQNFQAARPNSATEWTKLLYTRAASWWFAYTSLSAELVLRTGYPESRLTIVENTVDTTELQTAFEATSQEHVHTLKATLGIATDNVGVYCGGIYADKKIDFLVRSCVEIRRRVPDFNVVVIGSGPEEYKARQAASRLSWFHYVGPHFGARRAIYFRLGKLMLMPGLVGLAIVDSFVARLPLFTTAIPSHSPEIAYLQNGINGVITPPQINAYADAVAAHLTDDVALTRLQNGCRISAARYTMENMVSRFAGGIESCLRLDAY